jgi:hypothetical protein
MPLVGVERLVAEVEGIGYAERVEALGKHVNAQIMM